MILFLAPVGVTSSRSLGCRSPGASSVWSSIVKVILSNLWTKEWRRACGHMVQILYPKRAADSVPTDLLTYFRGGPFSGQVLAMCPIFPQMKQAMHSRLTSCLNWHLGHCGRGQGPRSSSAGGAARGGAGVVGSARWAGALEGAGRAGSLLGGVWAPRR